MINNFSIPADFKPKKIEEVAQLNEKYKGKAKINEIYGQITVGNLVGSGRANDLLPQVDFPMLESYVRKLDDQGIGFNYTLNTTCVGNQEFDQEFSRKLKDFLNQLDYIGIHCITVGMPSIVNIIKQGNYSFKLKISTVCQINNAEKALAYKRMGADAIVLDESVNRDFKTLKNIRKAFEQQVELIANVICHKNCIYEIFHHNQTSHDNDCNQSKKSIPFYSHRCMLQRCENPENLLKLAWIRPEDLIHYNDIGYYNFKIQGRQAAENGNILKTTEAYMMRMYDGNFMLLLDCFQPTNAFIVHLENKKLNDYITPFYRQDDFCNNYCEECQYCKKYIQTCCDYDQISETFNLANTFYREMEEDYK